VAPLPFPVAGRIIGFSALVSGVSVVRMVTIGRRMRNQMASIGRPDR